jgi:hypothetical protein
LLVAPQVLVRAVSTAAVDEGVADLLHPAWATSAGHPSRTRS